ncbi:hypothetical protein C2E23DRAFT_890775 [Lenzites betulinus]|nr:hypothetical protein C2E23DRAFT_890775 [Lenzites betulinus]
MSAPASRSSTSDLVACANERSLTPIDSDAVTAADPPSQAMQCDDALTMPPADDIVSDDDLPSLIAGFDFEHNYYDDMQSQEGGLLRPPPPLVNGEARIHLLYMRWRSPDVDGPIEGFVYSLDALDSTGEPITHKLHVPGSLEEARALTFHDWNARAEAVRTDIGALLQPSQREAITTVVYVYIWFTQDPPTGESARAIARWSDLQQMLPMLATMGLYLNTPGERLIYNICLWARDKIEEALPLYLRGAVDPLDPSPPIGAPEPQLLDWDQ